LFSTYLAELSRARGSCTRQEAGRQKGRRRGEGGRQPSVRDRTADPRTAPPITPCAQEGDVTGRQGTYARAPPRAVTHLRLRFTNILPQGATWLNRLRGRAPAVTVSDFFPHMRRDASGAVSFSARRHGEKNLRARGSNRSPCGSIYPSIRLTAAVACKKRP
jgi:hypothetical protein